jgi:hypothetical protein
MAFSHAAKGLQNQCAALAAGGIFAKRSYGLWRKNIPQRSSILRKEAGLASNVPRGLKPQFILRRLRHD